MNTIAQYSPLRLRHKVYRAHAANGMPEKTLLPLSPSVLGSQLLEPEAASMLFAFIAILNLGNTESQPARNQTITSGDECCWLA
jgi:hypothetical protein